MSPRQAQAVRGTAGDPAAALREHLIDTAEGLLADRQANAITTRDIARAANVSDGVLYNYFADKNELLLTALTRRFVELVEKLRTEMPEPGSRTVEANLELVAQALHGLHVAAFPIVGSLLAEPALLHRFMGAIHSADEPLGGKQIRDTVIAYIVAEQKRGRLAPADAGAAADLLIGAIAALVFTGHLGQGSIHAESIHTGRLPAIVHTLVRGLTPQRRRS